jgi:rhamnogalacturonyl hydrolase YesR
MLHSLRKGYLKGDKYEAVALRSVKGIVERIAADGELADVRCVALNRPQKLRVDHLG